MTTLNSLKRSKNNDFFALSQDSELKYSWLQHFNEAEWDLDAIAGLPTLNFKILKFLAE